MLLLVWILRFCPKRNQESPDRCGEAIAPRTLQIKSSTLLASRWSLDIKVDIRHQF
ncbi:MAG: hypothetical protein ACYT04_49880 [Nostoc sp.]